MDEKENALKTVKAILKKTFKIMAFNEVIEKEYNKVLRNKCAKVGINLDVRIEDEALLNTLEAQEKETEKKLCEKYGIISTVENVKRERLFKKLFNKIALEYSIRYLATEEQKENLKPLLEEVNNPLYVDRLFNINSRLDIFIEGIKTEDCLKMEV